MARKEGGQGTKNKNKQKKITKKPPTHQKPPNCTITTRQKKPQLVWN